MKRLVHKEGSSLLQGGVEGTQRIALSEIRERIFFDCCRLSLASDPSQVFVFSKDVIRIGAHQESDLVIPDETVSRQHCELRRDGESYRLIDEGSTNGTFVGKLRVRDALLYHGCE
ncbi:MAG: FHA domain-containing protein, partial [Myxococcota bacterium]|nr:FHA domain-containing protein [Myxococcota bacterium]